MDSSTSLYQAHNSDNVFMRSVLGGLLNLLNNTLKYQQVWSQTEIETITVPFYMDLGSSDERMMQDNFTFFGDICTFPKKIDGNFDKFPRGAIKYTGSTIDSGNITNRFIEGHYIKEIDGKLESFVSCLFSIPQTVTVECEVDIDNLISAMKIEQAIKECFYKNKTYYVLFRGLRIGCCVGFPEQYNLDKTISYSFDTSRQIKLTFTLGIETYQPVFDPTTEMKASNTIKSFGMDVNLINNTVSAKIIPISPSTNQILPKGTPLSINWEYYSTNREMLSISISYQYNNNFYTIANGITNNTYYIWNIPDDFTTFISPEITIINSDECQVYKNPNIKIIPNLDGTITSSSFVILDGGTFYSATAKSQIEISLDYTETSTGKLIVSDSGTIYLNISDGQVDSNNPITITKPLTYNNPINYKTINIKIADALHPDEVYGTIDNITII